MTRVIIDVDVLPSSLTFVAKVDLYYLTDLVFVCLIM